MEGNFIVGIYNYKENNSGYYLIELFANSDSYDLAPVEAVLEDVLLKGVEQYFDGSIGPFKNLSELNQFAFGMCEKSGADWIGLISVKEYNQLLDNITNLDEYRSRLVESVNVMENINKKKGTKGIMKRLFD